jgi:hypothetical protein
MLLFAPFVALRGIPQSSKGVVVQLVRIPACHAGGRGFESRPLRQNFKTPDLLIQSMSYEIRRFSFTTRFDGGFSSKLFFRGKINQPTLISIQRSTDELVTKSCPSRIELLSCPIQSWIRGKVLLQISTKTTLI